MVVTAGPKEALAPLGAPRAGLRGPALGGLKIP
jgi:hypothetical protein